MESGASMHNAEQGELSSDTMDTLTWSKTPYATLRDREQCKETSKHKFWFMISICSQQCNHSMKRQRFSCCTSFAQNADIHLSGKRRNCTIDQRWEDNYLHNGPLSTSRCIKTVIIFQQQFVFNIEINGSVQLFQQIWNIIRFCDDCGKLMLKNLDKQASGNHGPAHQKT